MTGVGPAVALGFANRSAGVDPSPASGHVHDDVPAPISVGAGVSDDDDLAGTEDPREGEDAGVVARSGEVRGIAGDGAKVLAAVAQRGLAIA